MPILRGFSRSVKWDSEENEVNVGAAKGSVVLRQKQNRDPCGLCFVLFGDGARATGVGEKVPCRFYAALAAV